MDQIEVAEKLKDGTIELRKRLRDTLNEQLYNDDNLFERFLVARELNIDAAETMLRNHVQWREQMKVDSFLTDFTLPKVSEYMCFSPFGYDKEGSPIAYFACGKQDSRGIHKAIKRQDLFKSAMFMIEKLLLQLKDQNEKNYQVVFVMDFDRLRLAEATYIKNIEFWMDVAQVYESHYPERLKSCFVINAQFYFMFGWTLVKPFLPPRTLSKIQVFGRDGWKPHLKEMVDSSVLPAFLGGSRTDPDGNPLCKSVCNHGKKVPESLYLKKPNFLAENPDADRLVVSRRSKVELEYEVLEAGSDLLWKFDVSHRDIGYRLLYRNSSSSSSVEELVPYQRVETSIVIEEGLFKCQRPGVYIIEFDNSYSWMFSKELHYKIIIRKGKLSNP